MRLLQEGTRRSLLAVAVAIVCGGLSVFAGAEADEAVCVDRDRDAYFVTVGCGTQIDCNDADLDTHPNAVEKCDGRDNDCDGVVDESCFGTCESWQRRQPVSAQLAAGEAGSLGAVEMSRARHGYGAARWQRVGGSISGCDEALFTRVGESGEERGSLVELKVGATAQQADNWIDVEWTGREFLVVAAIATDLSPDCTDNSIVYQVTLFFVGPRGNFSRPPVVLSCASALPYTRVEYVNVIWTGDRAIVSWRERTSSSEYALFATTVDPEEGPTSACGMPLALDHSSEILAPAVGWSGSDIGVVYGDVPTVGARSDLFFRAFTRELAPLGLSRLRLTNRSTARDWNPALSWNGLSWGIVWESETETGGNDEISFVRVGAVGETILPPGVVPVTTGADIGGHDLQYPDLAWTGREFVSVYTKEKGPVHSLLMARVSQEGEVLEKDHVFSLAHENTWGASAIVWSGDRFALAYERASSPGEELVIGFQGCECQDTDGDLVSVCAGDCDDTNPLVRPGLGQFEICGDGWDNECDGLRDCEDEATCPAQGPLPGTVSGVVFGDNTTLVWDDVPGADTYDVARGRLVDLRFEGDLRWTTCAGSGETAASLFVPEVPVISDGLFYLVRAWTGDRAACQVGTWGNASRDETVDVCP